MSIGLPRRQEKITIAILVEEGMNMGCTVSVEFGDWRDAPVSLGPGIHEFAVGDSHGLSEHLDALLGKMGEQSAGAGRLTILGDLCDRGRDTLGCYRTAFSRSASDMGFADRVGLLGNHEIFLVSAMSGGWRAEQVRNLWMTNGGDKVVAELEALGLPVGTADDLAGSLRAALGPELSSIVENLATHREAGNLLFVHAGLHPDVPIREWFSRERLCYSTEDHFAWIRFPFLGHEGPYEGGRMVVHGHTPEPVVQRWKRGRGNPGEHVLDDWRLGLDGGSYMTGIVSGAEFRDGAYRVYVAR